MNVYKKRRNNNKEEERCRNRKQGRNNKDYKKIRNKMEEVQETLVEKEASSDTTNKIVFLVIKSLYNIYLK